ncbi:hypothetical protein AB1Y20_021881 [Prymnesium parvum]|uniref:BSD domain-containing protein n=1 Tax=Prymnesium parvum TaxID=97485 RepID=A0AB34JEL7_PRYPA
MGANGSSDGETWPPGWEDIAEEPRIIARTAILDISAMAPADFLAIAEAPYVIRADEWAFSSYTSAATAAEDIKLNKIIYRLVPKHLTEEQFWRLYFSKVLYILDSIKQHGVYPPPSPPPAPAAAPVEAPAPAAPTKTSLLFANPGQMEETCLVM